MACVLKEMRWSIILIFFLAQPQTLQNNEFTLMTYDSTYYVAMRYAEIGKRAVDFSALPANCKGKCWNLMWMKN